MSMNVIKKQRDGIYNDLMQAATTLLPFKAQQGTCGNHIEASVFLEELK